MAITEPSDDRQAAMFLEVYRQTVINQLYNDLLADIKPKLKAAAQDAAKQLETSIQAYEDRMHHGLAVHLIVKGLEGKPDEC